MGRLLDIDGFEWEALALADRVARRDADPWHYAKVRFEPRGHAEYAPRETYLRLEEDVPARDVLDQYDDDYLIEVFLVAEEVEGGEEAEGGGA